MEEREGQEMEEQEFVAPDQQSEGQESKELFEHFSIDVDPGQMPLRIDKFLMTKIQNATRNKIQQAAKAGNILVNSEAVKSNYKVRPKDEIRIVLTYPPRDPSIYAEDIPLNVVYEDKDVLIIDKQAGLVVHPGHNNYTGTLLNGLKFYFEKQGEDADAFLVHRIDKDTSGLMIIAKNELAQAVLARQFFYHTIKRKYNALVWGDVKEDDGTVNGHIGRNPSNRLQMTVFPEGEDGKRAVTHYKVLKRFGYVTLVQCKLETGRTHQIRAHMKYLGHPLFNDEKYGGDKILKGTTFTKYKQFVHNCFEMLPRQALHAKVLGFEHPTTKENMYFESQIPEDMQSVIFKWVRYSKHMGEEG
jgi:23S rRNA pseudouridine1911/1915/1917 synthase